MSRETVYSSILRDAETKKQIIKRTLCDRWRREDKTNCMDIDISRIDGITTYKCKNVER